MVAILGMFTFHWREDTWNWISESQHWSLVRKNLQFVAEMVKSETEWTSRKFLLQEKVCRARDTDVLVLWCGDRGGSVYGEPWWVGGG